MPGYRAAIDIGGTFTDIIIAGTDGSLRARKLSSTPDDPARAVVQGMLGLLREHGIAPSEIDAVLHGSTIATNTILQEAGARVGLLTTKGFRDVLEIARLRRGSVYDLAWRPPRPLVRRAWRLELAERIDAKGRVLIALDRDEVLRQTEWLIAQGIEAIAIALISAHANPVHEAQAGELIRRAHPNLLVSVSSELSPVIREYERASTAVVNAYLQPSVSGYLERLEAGLRASGIGARLWIMQSNGGLVDVSEARRTPMLLIESGPAAGVRGAEAWAQATATSNVIALDVGGTTAKAALLEDGRASMVATLEVGSGMNAGNRLLRGVGYPINAPACDLAEVSAGGGTIAWVDDAGALRVGPRSAGADPGPACYGHGGSEPTVTDAYLVLGYLNPLGLGGRVLDHRLAETAIAVKIARPLGISVLEAADGICELAKTRMVGALKAVSTERGRDPVDFALLAFGGGGPVLAHALAEDLGASRVFIPPRPGLFSAFGMLLADARRSAAATLLRPLGQLDVADLAHAYERLEQKLRNEMARDGLAIAGISLQRTAELHYAGQDCELALPVASGELASSVLEQIAEAFAREHERVFGHCNPGERIILVNARVHASAPLSPIGYGDLQEDDTVGAYARRKAYFGLPHGMQEATVVAGRSALGSRLDGPAIIEEADTTIVVPPGWSVSPEIGGTLLLTGNGEATTLRPAGNSRPHDAITFEVMRLALASVADEMALALIRSAHSVGIRDIMDFSTSICDAEGQMVAQSQTLAIHLGAVPPAVAAVR